jgi:hypothetical protein
MVYVVLSRMESLDLSRLEQWINGVEPQFCHQHHGLEPQVLLPLPLPFPVLLAACFPPSAHR